MRRRAARLILGGLFLWPVPVRAGGKKPRVPVELYVMSQCPFGVQAEQAVLPAVKSLAKHVDFHRYFIGDETVPGQFRSLHGGPEVEEDVRQLCVEDLYPRKYIDYILERNKDVHNPFWEEAARAVKVDAAKVESCVRGSRGVELFSANLKAHEARNVTGSPTLFINGEKYAGARGPRSVTKALCASVEAKSGALPKSCAEADSLPDDVAPIRTGCVEEASPPVGPVP